MASHLLVMTWHEHKGKLSVCPSSCIAVYRGSVFLEDFVDDVDGFVAWFPMYLGDCRLWKVR
eukprot:480284-Ditylum_brightwellii.AAC.1